MLSLRGGSCPFVESVLVLSFLIAQEKAAKAKAKAKAKNKAKAKPKPKGRRPKAKAKQGSTKRKRDAEEDDEDDEDYDDDDGDGEQAQVEDDGEQAQVDCHTSGGDGGEQAQVEDDGEQAQVDCHTSGGDGGEQAQVEDDGEQAQVVRHPSEEQLEQVESEVVEQHSGDDDILNSVAPVELFGIDDPASGQNITGPPSQADEACAESVREVIADSSVPVDSLIAELDTAAPSASSSSVPAAPVPNVAQGDHPKASSSQVAPVGKGPKSGGGGGGPKVYQSPQILTRCEPNFRFKVGLDYNAHRFYVKCSLPLSDFLPPYDKQKSFSKSFASDRKTWRTCLELVHHHCWSKWELVKDRYPLAPNQIKQKPGVVPEDVLNEIEQEVNNLGPPTQYK